MDVYTSNIRHDCIDKLDITVKSGVEWLAPTWQIVMDLKNNKISWEQYVEAYTDMMRKSFVQNSEKWERLLEKDRIVLVCYCSDVNRCHRKLLAEMLEKCGATYKGEI